MRGSSQALGNTDQFFTILSRAALYIVSTLTSQCRLRQINSKYVTLQIFYCLIQKENLHGSSFPQENLVNWIISSYLRVLGHKIAPMILESLFPKKSYSSYVVKTPDIFHNTKSKLPKQYDVSFFFQISCSPTNN